METKDADLVNLGTFTFVSCALLLWILVQVLPNQFTWRAQRQTYEELNTPPWQTTANRNKRRSSFNAQRKIGPVALYFNSTIVITGLKAI